MVSTIATLQYGIHHLSSEELIRQCIDCTHIGVSSIIISISQKQRCKGNNHTNKPHNKQNDNKRDRKNMTTANHNQPIETTITGISILYKSQRPHPSQLKPNPNPKSSFSLLLPKSTQPHTIHLTKHIRNARQIRSIINVHFRCGLLNLHFISAHILLLQRTLGPSPLLIAQNLPLLSNANTP